MIEVRCYHSLVEAEPFRDAVNALNLASLQPDPFSTFEFYEHCLDEEQREARPDRDFRVWLLLAFSDGELVGQMALKQRTYRTFGVPAVKLDWLTAYMFGRPRLVSRPEHARAVTVAFEAYLLGRMREWSLLEFQQQDAQSELLSYEPQLPGQSSSRRWWPNPPYWRIPVQSHSLAGYFAALPKKSRSNISRQMRSLMAAGEVQVLSSADRPTVAALFDLYRHIESRSWKARAQGAAIDGRRSLNYYRRLLDRDRPMLIVTQILLLDGAPVGGLICGAFDKGLYALDIVYDDRYARLAPGSAILLLGVRLAIEGGFDFFDLLRGFGYYKSRWLAQSIATRSMQIYRVGSPLHWRRRVGDALRRWSGRGAANDEACFNPARRAAHESAEDRAAGFVDSIANPSRNTEHARLVAEALRGCGEFLNAEQLARALPFPTQPKTSSGVSPTPRKDCPGSSTRAHARSGTAVESVSSG
jgi:hypothetical protein